MFDNNLVLLAPDTVERLSIQTDHTFVLATPISGPAFMWQPHTLSLEMELPTKQNIKILKAR
jgi:hypothetical protein